MRAIITTMIARILTLTLLVLFASVANGQAGEFTVPLGKGNVTIAFPKSWTVSDIARGLEAKTKDDEVYVWAETYRENQSDQLMQEHEKYFAGQGVAVTGKVRSETKVVNGLTMTFMEVPATWKGDPTVLQYLLVDPGLPAGWKLLMTEWASPKGDKMYQPDLDSIIGSVSFSK